MRSYPSPKSIPARAGEPQERRRLHYIFRVYPRACGGTVYRGAKDNPKAGLSPRVRGNRVAGSRRTDASGSIPARAGEPCRALSRPIRSRVYPRACGGTVPRIVPSYPIEGLSPRVRGNLISIASPSRSDGSIPARAGEPPAPSISPKNVRVYPRACGGTVVAALDHHEYRGLSPRVRGNLRPGAAFRRASGLSPRVRGNHQNLDIRFGPLGSIPARAGEP